MTRSIDYERLIQIQSMVGTGTHKPADLTPEEDAAWKQAVAWYARAKENGWIVEIPGETPGSWADDQIAAVGWIPRDRR